MQAKKWFVPTFLFRVVGAQLNNLLRNFVAGRKNEQNASNNPWKGMESIVNAL
jgi:hypothetical protein